MLRKVSTVTDYRIIATKHLGPHFHTKTLEKITPDDVVAYIATKRHAGLAVKTITNHLNSRRLTRPRQVRARIVSRGANSSARRQGKRWVLAVLGRGARTMRNATDSRQAGRQLARCR